MRFKTVQIFSVLSMLIALNGCGHYELPFLTGDRTSNSSSNSTVNVDGVNDDVSSENIIIKRISFPADEYRQLKTSGDATVKGTISILYNGREIPGKQTKLYLNPVTSYSNQWYRESYLGGHSMGKSDPRLFNYLKFTASNAAGQFAFYGIPAGRYYVVGTVTCAECGGKNIRISRKISVKSSGTVTVLLRKSL